MSAANLDRIIDQMENYLECWKQFNHFLTLGREKRFAPEDEAQFLEVKSVIIQELELILASVDIPPQTKEEVHSLVGGVPSLRFLGEANDGVNRNLENQWHRLYIGWHSVLGQLKVRQRFEKPKSPWALLFAGSKA